ncbi:MAG: hypothetical protein Q9190_003567 [Brigantiaea leucoxantha]
MVQDSSASTLDNLSRLAAKPGVQSTLILSKVDGSIIRSSGLLALPFQQPTTAESRESGIENPSQNGETFSFGSRGNESESLVSTTGGINRRKSAEEVARVVFSFVNAAKDVAEDMESGDEVKLLRLRTRKNELVIVPGQSFSFGH